MRKLSIEQKAQRYDEAIEKLRTMMPNWERLSYNGKTFLQDLVHIFPELKENEDELTWLKRFIKEEIDCLSFDIRDSEDRVKLKNLQRSIAWLEKQGEQKPVFEMKTPEESLGIDSETYNKIVDECVYGEQKLTDKIESRQEELTEFEKAVKQVMEEAIECGDTHNLKADADLLLRLVLKPAWSKEDEWKFSDILALLRGGENCHYNTPDLFTWLKSLKDKYTWKPSDEQMATFWDAICTLNQDGYKWINDMKSLYQDLQKLK